MKMTPTSQATLTELAAHVLGSVTRREQALCPDDTTVFTLGGEPIGEGEVAHRDGLLPVFVWQAERMAEALMSRKPGLEAAFVPNSKALLGRTVSIDGFGGSSAEALLFLMGAFHMIRQELPRDAANPMSVPLDALVGEFLGAYPAAKPLGASI